MNVPPKLLDLDLPGTSAGAELKSPGVFTFSDSVVDLPGTSAGAELKTLLALPLAQDPEGDLPGTSAGAELKTQVDVHGTCINADLPGTSAGAELKTVPRRLGPARGTTISPAPQPGPN